MTKLEGAGCDKIFKEKRSGVDTGRPELKRCLEYLREGDALLVTKIDRLARSTSDLYSIVSAKMIDSRSPILLKSLTDKLSIITCAIHQVVFGEASHKYKLAKDNCLL